MKHFTPDEFHNCHLGMLLGRAALLKDRIIDTHMEPVGITAAQFKVLIIMAQHGIDTPVELCRYLSLDSGSMTRMLDRLEQKGFLVRQRSAEDRRQVQLVLTEAGQALADRLPFIGADAMNQLAEPLAARSCKPSKTSSRKYCSPPVIPSPCCDWGEMKRQTLRTRLSLVLLAMSLAGCASYSGLKTEGVSLEAKSLQAGQSLNGVALSPAAWPKNDWWKSLGDPQLDGLIREALRDSPDMQVASARVHQASAAAYAANAARLPTLDASGSVSRSRLARDQDPQGQGGAYSTLRSLSVDFNYNFDLWGGQRAAWEAALGQARAAEIDRQAAQLTLAADVARAYSDLGQAHIIHDLAAEDLKRTRQMLDLGKRRLSAGSTANISSSRPKAWKPAPMRP